MTTRRWKAITRTVNRPVAASERPGPAYKVTILNSAAVNAFAPPTGQLYATRGLVSLATDTSDSRQRCRTKYNADRETRDHPRGSGQAGRTCQSRGQRYGQ